MKKIFRLLAFLLIAGAVIFISCKKETSCEGCAEKNNPPIAVAGPDQVITLPTDSVSLDGSTSSDPDGTISEWLWTKISGPASFNITKASDSITKVKALVVGAYQFELKITDNGGLSAKDTVQVIVNDPSIPNRPPVANAGADQTITLPTNTITLNGNGSTDPDNNITSYVWTKISGPSSFSIANAGAVQTTISYLVQGVYQIELKVTDAGGLFSKDTMKVTITDQPCSQLPPTSATCDNSVRSQVCAQLIPIGTLSQARYSMAVASTGNKILFAGGNTVGYASSRVDIYDITTQSWSTAELSQARSSVVAVASGNKVLFAGGFIGQNMYSSRVDIYDISTNTWSTAELSQPRQQGIAGAVVGNKVFFAGGSLENGGVSTVVDIYDVSTNTWSTSNLSEAREDITATTAGSKVYFAGGWNGIEGVIPSGTIDIYDNATGSWSISHLSLPKAYMASIYKNGKIYWAGGTDFVHWGNNMTTTCSVEIKDIGTQTSSFDHLFQDNMFFNAFEKDNKIVYLPGIDSWNPNVPSRFDIYDVTTNTWSIGVLPQSSQSIAHGSIISVNNTIYGAGGSFINGVLSNQVWKLEF